MIHFGDMIVSGEKNGPMSPSYKKVGGILFAENPVAFDYVVTKLMGFNLSEKFPVLINGLHDKLLFNNEVDEIAFICDTFSDLNDANFDFEIGDSWKE